MIIKIFIILGLLLQVLFSFSLPEILDLPQGLSSNQTTKYTLLQRKLLDKENSLFDKVKQHNVTCRNVQENTSAAKECHRKMERLKSDIISYIDEVNQYNNELESLTHHIDSKTIQKEQKAYESNDQVWLSKQKNLIKEAFLSQKNRDLEILLAIENSKVPQNTQKSLNDLLPGDVILVNADDSLTSQGITYGDLLLRWMRKKEKGMKKYEISHSLVYLKTVNGKKLFLDHQLGDRFARVIDEKIFMQRYEHRLNSVARPKAYISGQKMWNAAKKSALKNNTPYGLYGNRVVCSDLSKFAIVQASDKKLSFLNESDKKSILFNEKKWLPIKMTPADFIDPKTKGRFFEISILKK